MPHSSRLPFFPTQSVTGEALKIRIATDPRATVFNGKGVGGDYVTNCAIVTAYPHSDPNVDWLAALGLLP